MYAVHEMRSIEQSHVAGHASPVCVKQHGMSQIVLNKPVRGLDRPSELDSCLLFLCCNALCVSLTAMILVREACR